MNENDLHPKSVTEALQQWDAGQNLFTIEMGGLGPGYEQAIQVFMFEALREMQDRKLPADADRDAFAAAGDAALKRIDGELGGITGAMYGAGLSLARSFYTKGWPETLALVESDRRIQVSRRFPGASP